MCSSDLLGISMIDALNVGPYAGRLKAPVLLTKTNEIDAGTLAEIERLKAKEVIIIGGVNAVSEKVANQLKAKGLTVNRIFGENRYETALKVAEETGNNEILKPSRLPSKIFLCSGISPPRGSPRPGPPRSRACPPRLPSSG